MLQLPSLALLLLPIPVAVAAVRPASAPTSPRVLVYTATGGYRHDSIPTAIQQLGRNAQPWGVQFVFTECALAAALVPSPADRQGSAAL